MTPIEEKVEQFNIHVIEGPEVEDRDNGEEAIWGEILTKNFPKSVKKKNYVTDSGKMLLVHHLKN